MNCDISPNFIHQHNYTYRLPVYSLIHVPLHLRILNPRLNHYTWQEKMSILKYFKPANDHLPDPEGILSSKLSSPAIASANSEVRSVIAIRHFPTHVAFKCNNYYRSCGEIRQTFFRQIDFFADSPNFNPSKLLSFTVFIIKYSST